MIDVEDMIMEGRCERVRDILKPQCVGWAGWDSIKKPMRRDRIEPSSVPSGEKVSGQ